MANISSSNGLKTLVPKLRFKGFDEEWQEISMRNIFSEIIEKNRPELPVLSILQGVGTVLRDSSDRRISYDKANLNNYKVIHKGDFIIHLRSFEGGLECSNHDGISSPAYRILRTKTLIPEAYKDYFRSSGFIDGKLSIAVTGIRDGKNIDMLSFWGIKIPVTSIFEQQKIAKFITLINTRIALQQKLIALLKSYKRGLSTALFTQKIKITKDNGTLYQKWEKCTLGDIFSERIERANGNEVLLAVTINNGVVNRSDLELKDNSSKDKTNYKVVRKNDLAYNTMRMWQGACGVSSFDGIVSPAYTVVYVKNNESNYTPFWGYYFKEISMQHIFQKNSQGLTSDTWNLKFDKFASIIVLSPTKSEQMHIATLLDYLSRKIGKHEEKLSKLQAYKNALLNKMFI